MPSKSPAQAKLMRAVAHGWKMPGGGGPSRDVARDFMNADQKAKRYFGGGRAEWTRRQKEKEEAEGEATLLQPDSPFGTEPVPIPQSGLAGMVRGAAMRAHGWTPSSGFLYPPQLTGLAGVGGGQIPYARPAPSTRTGTDFDPGSLAEQIYNDYGIIDPTWTEQDRTSRAALREDPYAHLGAGDPAREEYEGWDQDRADEAAQREMFNTISTYPERDRGDSEHRERLRQHKATVADTLGGYEGGAVEMQFGGLAQALRGRMGGGRRGARGRSRRRPNMRRANDARRPSPQMMAMMRAKQQGGGRRGMTAPGLRQSQKQVGLGGPRRVQPGGPGGMPGGRPEMLNPDDARMPGGRAMPFRGFQQRQGMMNRGNLGGNRVGQSDQQGGLARALQRGTGRPPMSRRSAFPGQRR